MRTLKVLEKSHCHVCQETTEVVVISMAVLKWYPLTGKMMTMPVMEASINVVCSQCQQPGYEMTPDVVGELAAALWFVQENETAEALEARVVVDA